MRVCQRRRASIKSSYCLGVKAKNMRGMNCGCIYDQNLLLDRVSGFGGRPQLQTLDIPLGPMPWDLACCHTGCLLYTEGMTTRMGQKVACGAKGGIMDRTKN